MDRPKGLENLKINTPPVYKKVSIVIPVYNEIKTIKALLEVVRQAPVMNMEKEIIVIDDHSSDGTAKYLREMTQPNIKTIFHERNQGKSASLTSGFMVVTGDLVIVQDADLEYDPFEYELLIRPFLTDRADVVMGSRYLENNLRQVPRFWHTLGNRIFTFFTNILTNRYFSDVHSCYKAFNRQVLEGVAKKIDEKRFGFDPAFAAKVARGQYKIIEVPISYYPRTHQEGKHLGVWDVIETLWVIVKNNLG